MYAAILGNHPYISIAELQSVFPDADFHGLHENVLLFSGVDTSTLVATFPKLGGVIKIIHILPDVTTIDHISDYLTGACEGKITFGVNFYGTGGNNLNEALGIKKLLKKHDRSARVVNTKPENLGSASTIHNKLIQKQSEINIMFVDGKKYIGYSLCIQDIDTYSDRDTSKSRSMSVGMLPPKLAQIMINLAQAHEHSTIYDPFVGLGTVLIEAAHHGYEHLAGSDIKPDLVDRTRQNVSAFGDKNHLTFSKLDCFEHDATRIADIREKLHNTTIITESYLGRLFTHQDIHEVAIEKEKQILKRIYSGFFGGLHQADFSGTIIITIPFWQIGKQKLFFRAMTEILEKYDFCAQPILKEPYTKYLTTRNTLLYSRSDQVVGRELYKITRT